MAVAMVTDMGISINVVTGEVDESINQIKA